MAQPYPYLAEVEELPRLVGQQEIRRLLDGIGSQRFSQLRASAGFPPPALTLGMGSVWYLEDIQTWLDVTGYRRRRRSRPTEHKGVSA